MTDLNASERRRHLRYNPSDAERDDLTRKSIEAVAHIDPHGEHESFRPTLVGIIVEKSHSGCGLILARSHPSGDALVADALVLIKAGLLHPMSAKVHWRKELGEDVFKVGIEFLE